MNFSYFGILTFSESKHKQYSRDNSIFLAATYIFIYFFLILN